MARGERTRAASGRAGRNNRKSAQKRASSARSTAEAASSEHEQVGSHAAERARPGVEARLHVPETEHARKDMREAIGAMGHTAESAIDRTAELADGAQAGLGAVAQDMMSNAGDVVERTTRTMQQLMAAKTLQDMVRLQFDLAGILIDAQMRYVQALTRMANDLGRSTADTLASQARQAARRADGRGARRS